MKNFTCLALIFLLSIGCSKGIELKGHVNKVRPVAFSSDGKKILTASWDKTARIWDVASGKELQKLDNATYIPLFPWNGNRIITLGGGSVRIWDTDTGKMLKKLSRLTDYINSAAISPDGKKVVTGGGGGAARIWILEE